MDLVESPDSSGAEPSFRKPSSDAANRKYRRHSPVGPANSSSSGSPKRERSHSPIVPMDDRNKMTGDRRGKDNMRELERDASHHQSSRGDHSRGHSDRSSYGYSHNYRGHNGHGRYERLADEEDKINHRSSQYDRQSRNGSRYDHARHDSRYDRSRDNWREVDKYTRDKPDIVGHRIKDKDRESIVQEHYRPKDRDSDRAKLRDYSGSRSIRDDVRTGERDKYTDREARDDRRDRYKSPGYKSDLTSHDLVPERVTDSYRTKEPHRRRDKEIDATESDMPKEKYTRELKEEVADRTTRVSTYRVRDGKHERFTDRSVAEDHTSSPKKLKVGHAEGDAMEEKKSSSSKQQLAESAEIAPSNPVSSITSPANTANDHNAAKVAALKAAELVNKNLVGVGGAYLSTDQKKKLLWGNKKSTTAEESQPTNRWDLQLFADRERQEKFNKLMSLRLPWYIWPIVGCKGRNGPRTQNGRQGRPEAEGAAEHGPGEAVHRWTEAKRWTDCRSWSVVVVLSIVACNEGNTSFGTLRQTPCKHSDHSHLCLVMCYGWLWTGLPYSWFTK